MKSAFYILILFLIIIFIGSAVRPFWTKHWIREDMKEAAIYGTKNSIEDTKKFLTQKMNESGRNFVGNDFIVEKNENDTVTISITYMDKISFFGLEIKTFEFTLMEKAIEVKEMF